MLPGEADTAGQLPAFGRGAHRAGAGSRFVAPELHLCISVAVLIGPANPCRNKSFCVPVLAGRAGDRVGACAGLRWLGNGQLAGDGRAAPAIAWTAAESMRDLDSAVTFTVAPEGAGTRPSAG